MSGPPLVGLPPHIFISGKPKVWSESDTFSGQCTVRAMPRIYTIVPLESLNLRRSKNDDITEINSMWVVASRKIQAHPYGLMSYKPYRYHKLLIIPPCCLLKALFNLFPHLSGLADLLTFLFTSQPDVLGAR